MKIISTIILMALTAFPAWAGPLTEDQAQPPRFVGIAQGAVFRCNLPTVKWTPVPEAKGYKLQLASDPEFNQIVLPADTVEASWTPTALPVGDYFLRVRAILADGSEGVWAEPLKFSILAPYASPKLEKPKKESGRILLRWTDIGPGLLYQVQISKTKGFAIVLDEKIFQTAAAYIVEPEDTGVYYVRVKAFDASGCASAFSAYENFRIGSFLSGLLTPCWLAPLAVIIYLLAR
jgi:predicted phage tail protein